MLVSVITPTKNRRHLLPTAISCFLSQDWPDKEMLVLDDGDDNVSDLCRAPGVRYERCEPATIGKKLDILSRLARGEIVLRMDDDDWSAPERMREQVEALTSTGAALAGYNSIYFWDENTSSAYEWLHRGGFVSGGHSQAVPVYICGASMCYWRETAERYPWPDKRVASDNDVLYAVQIAGEKVIAADGRQRLVARAHRSNTSNAERIGQNGWPQVPVGKLPARFVELLPCA